MPKASVKRLIECNKNQLIDLVLDIEKYPEFVPFCLDAHIYEKNNEGNLISSTSVDSFLINSLEYSIIFDFLSMKVAYSLLMSSKLNDFFFAIIFFLFIVICGKTKLFRVRYLLQTQLFLLL